MASQTTHDPSEADFDKSSRIPLDGRTIKNILRVASLQMKMCVRTKANGDERMRMDDVKAVLSYRVGGLENKDVAQKANEFYNASG